MGFYSLRGISKSFPSTGMVLAGIDLEFQRGERVYILGPTGAGKSTLLKIMSGRVAPDEGVAQLEGAEVRGLGVADLAPRLVYVHQDSGKNLLEDQSILENLVIADQLTPNRIPWFFPAVRTRTRFEKVLAESRLPFQGRLEDPVSTLSGGERQLLSLFMASLRGPRIYLLDEPTSALDIKSHEMIHRFIASVFKRDGATALFVTHRLSEALRNADRILLLRDGKISGKMTRESPRWTLDVLREFITGEDR